MAESKPLHELAGRQKDAVQPDDNIWLSASAGTGKTQVLTARVFRLLLRERVDPEHILCLTFTKAGAAEMADRIHRQLADWVRMPGPELGNDLRAIGAPTNPETRDYARTLFARVLDAPGGGMRIMTIHSFCQMLLASFPEEAGLSSMFKPMEERDRRILAREALADLLVTEEAAGRTAVIEALQQLSIRLGEDSAEQYLMTCASHTEAMQALASHALPQVRAMLDLPVAGDGTEWLASQCSDEHFPVDLLQQLLGMLGNWRAKTADLNIEKVHRWLSSTSSLRAEKLADLDLIWSTASGGFRKVSSGLAKVSPGYEEVAEELHQHCRDLLGKRQLFDYADLLAQALEAGRRFYEFYSRAKALHGAVDFDDMIRLTAKLLGQSNMADWIKYKLDQRTDHILVDEAQDTNAAQWEIIKALSEDYFTGQGARDNKVRTLFTVGDFKQAIFGFQGTSPQNYVNASAYFFERAQGSSQEFKSLSLDRSFRSTPPILTTVDVVFDQLGADALGLKGKLAPHESHFDGGAGSVLLLPPVAHGAARVDGEGEENWINDEKREFAQKLALQIKRWLTDGSRLWLDNKQRYLEPKDVMILVSKRDELSSLIVARLYAENVPVAGIDRIRLDQPLVVQDILAALRFVLQPEDDLNLAALLVSPLLGWSQKSLLEHGYRTAEEQGLSLWQKLQRNAEIAEQLQPLRDLLNMADLNTPYQFMETILSGSLNGRRKLLARLSEAARDPLEELLNTAIAFEQDHVPTLQGFVDWFDRGDVEIKRDPDEGGNEVRLMTVHGAKGLQAPLVILANATFDPGMKRSASISLTDFSQPDSRISYPAIPVRKAERVGILGALSTLSESIEREEHWRLLYVALTRAEEHLVVGGTLGPRANGQVPMDSWYKAVACGLEMLPCTTVQSDFWDEMIRYDGGIQPSPAADAEHRREQSAEQFDELPKWSREPAPAEARPPRPLAPSDLGSDDADSPPASAASRLMAARGVLLHSLFQRLPDIAAADRYRIADSWLEKQKGIRDKSERQQMIQTVLNVLDTPEWTSLFSADSLAEAPVAAVVGEHVVSGVVDRLLIGEEEIQIVDFKTGRKVPESVSKVPVAYLRQMAAYAAALEKIFPDRTIKAALLYSHQPRLLELSADILTQHKPGLEPT